MEPNPVLLIGASCRAAAEALKRQGIPSVAWDMFADRDTSLACGVRKINSLTPTDAGEMLDMPCSFVLPCGGLENAPELWSELSQKHCMLGPSLKQLAKLRDPVWLSEFCKSHATKMKLPTTMRSSDTDRERRHWLVKSTRSAAGLSVRHHNNNAILQNGEYLQELIKGTEFGVTVSSSNDGCHLLAGTLPITHGFVYAGSIGPIELARNTKKHVEQFFELLCNELQFQGVLQADLIQRDGEVFLLEINPRWTAGMEIAETLSPASLLAHFRSQDDDSFEKRSAKTTKPIYGTHEFLIKQIIYADQALAISQGQSDYWMRLSDWTAVDRIASAGVNNEVEHIYFRLADIPEPDCTIEARQPLCTLLVRGSFADGKTLKLESTTKLEYLMKIADALHPLKFALRES